jgi:SAM-dependent methyltransferase
VKEQVAMVASVDSSGDYILGTDEEELARLELQNQVWRPHVLKCWREAGIANGSHVLDVGAGPGYASADLATLVGYSGRVTALERSQRFVAALEQTICRRSIQNITVHRLDLMYDELPRGDYDFSWCRWVATFVDDCAMLIAKLASVLRSGSVAVFHEYAQYATWRLAPRLPIQEEFVQRVTDSWRATGGDPDVALRPPFLLNENGFRLRKVVPRIYCLRPADTLWQWLASFIDSGARRLEALQLADAQFAEDLRTSFRAREENGESFMISPLLLEIIAIKEARSLAQRKGVGRSSPRAVV